MDIKNFEKYVKLCRKLGVTELKTGDFEVKLTADPPKSSYREKKELREIAKITPDYNDEDILFWSSTGIAHNQEVNNA